MRGIRDLGYRHTGTAIDELIDNSLQASAKNVHVAFGFEGKSTAKPSAIAVIDDGHGMEPEMIRLAVVWGGTHRENDRSGFGRFGYGLGSACVSQGRRFGVYSRTDEKEYAEVVIDVDAIGAGEYTDDQGQIVVPTPTKTELPEWVQAYVRKHLEGKARSVRSVVIIDKLDRLDWVTGSALERHLLEHFGTTYRNFLRQNRLFVQGKQVQAIDPLFTTAGARFYDVDDDRAEALPPLSFEVKDEERKPLGTVNVRYSYMPPTFQRADKSKQRGKTNARFNVMKDNNGIIVLRNGRQIDVLRVCPWTTFVNYDRNVGVEIDFPAQLDEEFSITTNKQQVVLSNRMWDLLEQNGVHRAITELRRRFKKELSEHKAGREKGDGPKRASEQAMEETSKFRRSSTSKTAEREQRAEEQLKKEAKRRAKQSGLPEEDIERQLKAEAIASPYRVEHEGMKGAPFFHAEQRGGQTVLILNTDHPFYTDVYAAPDSTPRLRAGLEVLLFVIGESELDALDEREIWYQMERQEWSNRLLPILQKLEEIDSIDDELASLDEEEVPA